MVEAAACLFKGQGSSGGKRLFRQFQIEGLLPPLQSADVLGNGRHDPPHGDIGRPGDVGSCQDVVLEDGVLRVWRYFDEADKNQV